MQVALLNDQALIELYLEGDEKAFQTLLQRHKSRIFTQIYLFVRDQALAQDIFQEVFIKIINTLRKGAYNHEGKFVQWAMRIAYNMCVDHHRRHKRRYHIGQSSGPSDFDIFDIIKNGDEAVDSMIMKSETHNRVRQLIDQLPVEQREVVVLRHYADIDRKSVV